jgi:hypothetical protein
MADEYYVRGDRGCGCARCRMRGLMAPAFLVTLGVLLLFNEFHVVRFHYTWPVILIVIGVVKVLIASASLEGHRGLVVGPQGGPGGPQPPSGPGSDPSQVKNA